MATYNCSVDGTEVHLADELTEVCKDYCKEVWIEAVNLAGVPATSEWRKKGNIFCPQDIRVVPLAFPLLLPPRPPRLSSFRYLGPSSFS